MLASPRMQNEITRRYVGERVKVFDFIKEKENYRFSHVVRFLEEEPGADAYFFLQMQEALKEDGKAISKYQLWQIPDNNWSVRLILRGLIQSNHHDAEAKKLQDQLDLITNKDKTGRLDVLEQAEADLEKLVKETILPQLQFALDYEGGLQAYIDDNDAATLAAAKEYTDAEVQKVRDELNAFKAQMYDLLHQLASRIQSIVYVPDYDDLKITSNMAKTDRDHLQDSPCEVCRRRGRQLRGSPCLRCEDGQDPC